MDDLPCFHLRVSVGRWQSDDARRLDQALLASGSHAIDLPWDALEICEDNLHFSTVGANAFARALCEAVAALWRQRRLPRRLLVISDSTIGHHDYDDDGVWTGGASEALAAMLVEEVEGLDDVHVDAVCGSGFVACAREGHNYRARLARRKREASSAEACLFIGGWNDLADRHSIVRTCAAAQAGVRLACRRSVRSMSTLTTIG